MSILHGFLKELEWAAKRVERKLVVVEMRGLCHAVKECMQGMFLDSTFSVRSFTFE